MTIQELASLLGVTPSIKLFRFLTIMEARGLMGSATSDPRVWESYIKGKWGKRPYSRSFFRNNAELLTDRGGAIYPVKGTGTPWYSMPVQPEAGKYLKIYTERIQAREKSREKSRIKRERTRLLKKFDRENTNLAKAKLYFPKKEDRLNWYLSKRGEVKGNVPKVYFPIPKKETPLFQPSLSTWAEDSVTLEVEGAFLDLPPQGTLDKYLINCQSNWEGDGSLSLTYEQDSNDGWQTREINIGTYSWNSKGRKFMRIYWENIDPHICRGQGLHAHLGFTSKKGACKFARSLHKSMEIRELFEELFPWRSNNHYCEWQNDPRVHKEKFLAVTAHQYDRLHTVEFRIGGFLHRWDWVERYINALDAGRTGWYKDGTIEAMLNSLRSLVVYAKSKDGWLQYANEDGLGKYERIHKFKRKVTEVTPLPHLFKWSELPESISTFRTDDYYTIRVNGRGELEATRVGTARQGNRVDTRGCLLHGYTIERYNNHNWYMNNGTLVHPRGQYLWTPEFLAQYKVNNPNSVLRNLQPPYAYFTVAWDGEKLQVHNAVPNIPFGSWSPHAIESSMAVTKVEVN